MEHAAHNLFRFTRQVDKVEHGAGSHQHPRAGRAEEFGELVANEVAMATPEAETELVEQANGQPLRAQAQRERAPYHEQREVEEPFPQPHMVGTHQFHAEQQHEERDEVGEDAEASVHEVVCGVGP